jgi:hypothetical protein
MAARRDACTQLKRRIEVVGARESEEWAVGVVAMDRGDRHGGEKVIITIFNALAHLRKSVVVSQPMVVVALVTMQ